MPRIIPVDWKTLVRVFELYGCEYKRKKGLHHILIGSSHSRQGTGQRSRFPSIFPVFCFSWRSLRLGEEHKPFPLARSLHSLKPQRSLRKATCLLSFKHLFLFARLRFSPRALRLCERMLLFFLITHHYFTSLREIQAFPLLLRSSSESFPGLPCLNREEPLNLSRGQAGCGNPGVQRNRCRDY